MSVNKSERVREVLVSGRRDFKRIAVELEVSIALVKLVYYKIRKEGIIPAEALKRGRPRKVDKVVEPVVKEDVKDENITENQEKI